MIKIAFLTISLKRGGAERTLSVISQNMNTFNHILILYKKEIGYKFTNRVYELDNVNIKIPLISKVFRLIKRLFTLRKIIKKEKIDVLISSLVRPNILNIFFKLIGFFKGKTIIKEESIPSKHKKYRRYELFLIKFLYRYADKIFVPSSGVKKDLIENFSIPSNKIVIIPNPVDLKAINKLILENVDFPCKTDKLTVISAGRLTESKGFNYLIEAFYKVREKVESQLIILGDGELDVVLKELVKKLSLENDVHFLGWQENPYKFFKFADVFVLSSLHEGFGNVLVEAMACGLPVISFDCPSGPREIIGENEFGLLVPLKDVDALSEAIFKILTDSEIRDYYRRKSLERCKVFDVENIIKIWEEEIKNCIGCST